MLRKVSTLGLAMLLLIGSVKYYITYHHYAPCALKKVHITLENLPDAFEGFTIGHLSDIHCGNFKDEKALREAITLLMRESPDVIFITGDVIERHVEEMERFAPLLKELKAKEGVYAVLGNHEYGPTHLHKTRDATRIAQIQAMEASFGWDLLLNENRILEREDNKLAIVGVENYSTGLFPTYGNLTKASQGTEKASVRLLLSHDPSHWEAKVTHAKLPIDVMFSGHTHGAKIKLVRGNGCPVHVYKQYHGLYQKGKNYIYVSSGIGNSKKFGRRFKKREIPMIILQKATPNR